MNRLYIYMVFPIAMLLSCSSTNSRNQQLQDQIISVHDSIMPKMGEFVRDELKIGVLSNKMDSLKALHPKLDTLKEKEALLLLQQELKEVNETMTDWMHDFEPEQEDKKPEEAQKYFEEELQKVRTLKEKFLHAEEESKRILAKYK